MGKDTLEVVGTPVRLGMMGQVGGDIGLPRCNVISPDASCHTRRVGTGSHPSQNLGAGIGGRGKERGNTRESYTPLPPHTLPNGPLPAGWRLAVTLGGGTGPILLSVSRIEW